jgi:hypothetical protein
VGGNGLERIADEHGNLQYTLTDAQHARGRNVGKLIQQNCYTCRKYLDKSRNTTYNQTNLRCRHCHMPLCKKSRGPDQTCVEEHYGTDDLQLGCNGNNCNYKVFPKELQVQFELYTTYRSPTTLPMPPLPTSPTMENEEYDEEEVVEHTSDKILTVICAINKIE